MSIFAMRYWIQKCYYHPQGRWNRIEPSAGDVFITFFPIMNQIATIIFFLFTSWKHEDYRKKSRINITAAHFFQPKKELK